MDIGLGHTTALTLESRYLEHDTPVLMTGVQAVVRVLLEQARLDREAGHRTAGFVSGYRGSPLGGLDQELWRRKALLDAEDIRFQPGLNEDLGATMGWGAQMLHAFPNATREGVYSMWYGKGPGVDRTGDVFRCANMSGTSALGGALAVSGDDHGAQSSIFPHQTDHVFEGAMIPVFAPAHAQDIVDLGLAAYAFSRFTGLWAALKLTSETAEQAHTVSVALRRAFVRPADAVIPPHGLNYDPAIEFPAGRHELERRLMLERLPAAMAWARANRVDHLLAGGPDAPVGIVTVGKAHMDAVAALRRLGLEGDPRVALYKVGLVWPLEEQGLRDFARGRKLLIVVEEKRSFVERQVRDALYNMRADQRPVVVGKTDAQGAPLLPAILELSPELVADAVARMVRDVGIDVEQPEPAASVIRTNGLLTRKPAFCAGCPHSTSTKLPEGSFGTAGIGCHVMALTDSTQTITYSQMGGEGIAWLGIAPFTDVKHTFVNLGDGTYTHSGILAIRQAVAAGHANLTYKILYNDAVAMTGGQPAEGALTVVQIAHQVRAEGVQRIAILADETERLPSAREVPAGVTLHGRAELDAVQRALRDTAGVSVLIYDQVCATEKRRRRKRGKMAQAARHVVINEDVCENCGDCSVQSGCIAIEPVETQLGRKRRINPSACNVDLSCLEGFCPSFVTMAGPPRAPSASAQWRAREAELLADIVAPAVDAPVQAWRGLFAGIGGGGIVTAGAILAQAAAIEGREVSTLDFTGLAQKNGSVVSHVQIGPCGALDVARVPERSADVLIAADLAVSASAGVLERCRVGANVVGNMDLAATSDFKRDPRLAIDAALHRGVIERATGGNRSLFVHGEQLAEKLLGNAQAMNTVLLGMAWQMGMVPVGHAALMQAIELNGAAVKTNVSAFNWGRILAAKPKLAAEILPRPVRSAPDTLPALIDQRAAYLTDYQSAAYARLYRDRVARAEAAEVRATGRAGKFTRAAAEGWFRVMMVKDEYEVARLHASATYGEGAAFHMAPPLVTRRDPVTGRRGKIAITARVARPVFALLRRGKALRGTALDPFARQADRAMERAMVATYEADMRDAAQGLTASRVDAAARLAAWPDLVRGYGPVKEANRVRAEAERQAVRASLFGASVPA